jgi:hypothetical protein
MESTDLERTLATLTALGEFELALADLYEACHAACDPDDDLWPDLVKAEKRHSGYLERISRLIRADPGAFGPGRPITPAAADSQIQYVRKRTAEVAGGGIAPRTALLIAADLERSILESRFYELVTTDDEDYHRLVNVIVAETEEHADTLAARLRVHESR